MVRSLLLVPLLCISLGGCLAAGLGAGASVGVAATEERGVEGATDDLKIRAQINELWFRQDNEMFRKLDIDVSEGRVMLTGVVQKADQQATAVRLAWQVPGVHEVYDEIQIGDPTTVGSYGSDSVIATDLRSRLMFDGKIKNVNYTIEVVHGIVYLLGIAQDQVELDRAIAHARDISDVKRVVNHVILKTDSRRTGS